MKLRCLFSKSMKAGCVCKALFLVVAFSAVPRWLLGQEIKAPGYTRYTQYTSKDGLESSEVHCIHQDRDGFLWVGTNQGLCRFDSETWTVLTSIDGLPDNMVTKIEEDAQGRLWLHGLNETLFRLNKHTKEVFVPEFNQMLDSVLKTYTIQEWRLDSTGAGYLSVYENGTNKQWRQGSKDIRHVHFFRVEAFNLVEQITLGEYQYQFFKLPVDDKGLWAYNRTNSPNTTGFFSVKDEATGTLSYESNLSLPGFGAQNKLSGTPLFFQPDAETMLFVANNQLIEFDLVNEQVLSTHQYSNTITEVFQDADSNLFVGFQYQGGFAFYDKGDLSLDAEFFMDGFTCTSFCEDRANALWVGTTKAGIFRFYSSDFVPVNTPVNTYPITQLRKHKNRVFVIGNNATGLEAVYKNEQLTFNTLITEQTLLSDLWCSHDTCLASYRNLPTTLFFTNDSSGALSLRHPKNRGHTSIPLPGGNRALGYYSRWGYCIFDYSRMEDEYSSSESENLFRANCALKLDGENILIGTEKGVKHINGSSDEPIFRNALGGIYVHDMVKDQEGYLWVATKGNGLYRIHLATGMFNVLSIEEGLPINSIYDLEVANGIVFGATSRGLFAVKNLTEGPGKEYVEVWTEDDGLPTIELQELTATSRHLLLNCCGSLVAVNLETLAAPKTGCQIFMRGLLVNGSERSLDAFSELASDENNIRIRYQGFHYGQKNFSFWYKTKAGDQWTKTNNTELNLVDQAPGNYEVMVSPLPQEIVGKTMKLSFAISPPFTQTTAFLLLVVLASIAALSLAFWIILSRERLTRKLLVSQQQALTSQMNPHFIFNALNSVQYFIGEGSRKLAQSYLGEFALLMRQVLDSSRSGQISLAQEVQSLKTYIELERLRFEEQYSFEFDVDETTEKRAEQVVLPSMVIQPYVENAILHGLRAKERNGHLLLQFRATATTLRIAIRDNGIGRKAAEQLADRKGYTSHGMDITTERIQLLNKRLKKKISVSISDLEPSGTEVLILLPIDPLD